MTLVSTAPNQCNVMCDNLSYKFVLCKFTISGLERTVLLVVELKRPFVVLNGVQAE